MNSSTPSTRYAAIRASFLRLEKTANPLFNNMIRMNNLEVAVQMTP